MELFNPSLCNAFSVESFCYTSFPRAARLRFALGYFVYPFRGNEPDNHGLDAMCNPGAWDAEAVALERQISDLVNSAYGLMPEEVKLMWDTAPPRMPGGDRDYVIYSCAGIL